MKKFKEVKKGDYIYYIDHCKLHKQLVTFAGEVEFTRTYKSWGSNKTVTEIEKQFIIKAGRGTEITLGYWNKDSSDLMHYGIRRFASKEAVKDYVDRVISGRKYKANKLEKLLNQIKNVAQKYSEINLNV